MVAFNVNGKRVSVDADADTPLLWAIRDHLNLTGTKFGCGAGLLRRLHGACQRQGGPVVPDDAVAK